MVYVDDLNYSFGRMIMCHMFADTIEELHQMADKIGINRKWFQARKKEFPHYDICLSKKDLAIKQGAKSITVRETTVIYKTIESIGKEKK